MNQLLHRKCRGRVVIALFVALTMLVTTMPAMASADGALNAKAQTLASADALNARIDALNDGISGGYPWPAGSKPDLATLKAAEGKYNSLVAQYNKAKSDAADYQWPSGDPGAPGGQLDQLAAAYGAYYTAIAEVVSAAEGLKPSYQQYLSDKAAYEAGRDAASAFNTALAADWISGGAITFTSVTAISDPMFDFDAITQVYIDELNDILDAYRGFSFNTFAIAIFNDISVHVGETQLIQAGYHINADSLLELIEDNNFALADKIYSAGSSYSVENAKLFIPGLDILFHTDSTITWTIPTSTRTRALAVLSNPPVSEPAPIDFSALAPVTGGAVQAAFADAGSIYAEAKDRTDKASASEGEAPLGSGDGDPVEKPVPPKVVKIRTPLLTVYLNKKGTYQIPFVLDTTGGKPIQDTGLKIGSSNSRIAAVSKTGKVTAKKNGRAYITIKAQNGKKIMVRIVVVTKKISLKTYTVILPRTLKKGKSYQIKLSHVTRKATNVSKVAFKTSNKKIATVDKAGKLTIKKKGTVTVTVTVGKKAWKKKYRIR